MRELRLHRGLYAGTAVDEAVKVYARFARFELVEEAEHWLVRLEAATRGGQGDAERERRIAGELGNYALGLTVKKGKGRS